MRDDIFLIESTSPTPALARKRTGWLYIGLVAIVVLTSFRAFYLQVWQGDKYREEADGNRVMAVPIPAPRGIIRDAYDVDLVDNIASTDVVIDPVALPREQTKRDALSHKLAQILDIPTDKVNDAVNEAVANQRITKLATAINHDAAIAIEQNINDLPGVRTAAAMVRKYKFGQAGAHVIGYTGPVTADEIAEREELRSNDTTGKSGLEKKYEQQLRGEDGVKYIEINADGIIQKELNEREPQPGADLQLTIDIELQKAIAEIATEKKDEGSETKASAVIVLDAQSGAVRAIASNPAADPNIFSQPALRDQTVNVIKDESQPLFNRAVDGSYPPGSVIKPLLSAAALEEGVITPSTTILSNGGITIGIWSFPDWKAGGHGVTDVRKALAESVNTFFYVIVGGYEGKEGIGVDKGGKYLRAMGWGRPTGIDLPREAQGFIPSPEWKQSAKNEQWYIGDTYHMAIGQGDVLVSPLQVASTTAAIANGGDLNQPFLLRTIKLSDGEAHETTPKSSKINIKEGHLEVVRSGMRAAVTEGSAKSLSEMPIALAGKTGTAQIGGSEETHAWFTSFGPYEDPKIVVTVLVEKGGDGDKVAVPMAEKIWRWLYDHDRI